MFVEGLRWCPVVVDRSETGAPHKDVGTVDGEVRECGPSGAGSPSSRYGAHGWPRGTQRHRTRRSTGQRGGFVSDRSRVPDESTRQTQILSQSLSSSVVPAPRPHLVPSVATVCDGEGTVTGPRTVWDGLGNPV